MGQLMPSQRSVACRPAALTDASAVSTGGGSSCGGGLDSHSGRCDGGGLRVNGPDLWWQEWVACCLTTAAI